MPHPGSRRRRTAAAVACLTVGAGLAGCTGRPAPRLGPDSVSTPAAGHDCPVTAARMLGASDTRGLSRFVWQPSQRIAHPAPGAAPARSAPGYVRDYRCGAFVGFVTDLWWQPRWRADNDRRARALGYTPGSVPLVPFQGAIVAEHPATALEVYERVTVFRTVTGAQEYLAAQLLTPRYDPTERVVHVPGWPAGVTLVYQSYGAAPTDEVGLEAICRERTAVLQIRSQGGRKLSWSELHDLWATAKSRMASL